MKTIFATKLGMTSRFDGSGNWLGATVLKFLPAVVDSLRTKEKHGYEAARLKISDLRSKKEKFFFREVRGAGLEPGNQIEIEQVLAVGDKVQVSGISKGKGTAGVVKRHGFAGGPRTHGQSDRERAPGSSGSGTTPGRVCKGKRRAGRMGGKKVTARGNRVLEINAEKGILVISGSVPGSKSAVLRVSKV